MPLERQGSRCNVACLLSDGKHLVSFDTVVEAMKRTGHDLPHLYKETAEEGWRIDGEGLGLEKWY
ncbi:hypothetical protein MASR1M46_12810 [Bacteroidales bacterium]